MIALLMSLCTAIWLFQAMNARNLPAALLFLICAALAFEQVLKALK